MEYVSIGHNKQQTTNIHINVFVDIIKLLPTKIAGVKISDDPKVSIVRNNKNIEISFAFTISKQLNIFTTTNNIKKWIVDTILNLIDVKPHNILINYQGRH